tara:strand:- start:190 stop:951 length:762 start_codon:yes stop_codon:yes gene_type:complete
VNKSIKIGSLFSGIGGFELGLERAIPNSSTIWQVEQDKFCQKILNKHWPNAIIYDDVCTVGQHNLEPVDILCGGFPCQDISLAGQLGGIHGKKSGLWWQMHRIISELRPRIAVMENVSNLITMGLPEVLGSLSEIGYNAEWTIISASQFGAPHQRKRIFIVAYSMCTRSQIRLPKKGRSNKERKSKESNYCNYRSHGWKAESFWAAEPRIRRVDNGIPYRVDKLRALGNAIVAQCSEYIGQKIADSGLLDELY